MTLNTKQRADKLLANMSCRPSSVNSITGEERRTGSHVLWNSGYKTNVSGFVSLSFLGCMRYRARAARTDKKGECKSQTWRLCPPWRVSSFVQTWQPLASALVFGFTALFSLPKIKLIYSVHSLLNSVNSVCWAVIPSKAPLMWAASWETARSLYSYTQCFKHYDNPPKNIPLHK